jgi:hypothetical protein
MTPDTQRSVQAESRNTDYPVDLSLLLCPKSSIMTHTPLWFDYLAGWILFVLSVYSLSTH